MKHYNLLIFALISFLPVFTLTNCSKPETELTKTEVPEANELPHVVVIDNTLHFSDGEQYGKVVKLLYLKSDEEIREWSKSIGFVSINEYYAQANDFNCCPETDIEWEQLETNFNGKIKIDRVKGTYSPLLFDSKMNWILNKNGNFFIGNALQQFSDKKIISIIDPNMEKINVAKEQEYLFDIINKIFVHPRVLFEDSGVNERACPVILGNGTGGAQNGYTTVNCAPGGPLYGNQSSPFKYRVDEAWRNVRDDTAIYQTSTGALAGSILFGSSMKLHCQKRGIFGTWPTCHRTVWTVNTTLNYSHNLGTAMGAGPSPASKNYTNLVTGSECNWIKDDLLIDVNGVSITQKLYNEYLVTVNSMSLQFSTSPATNVTITGSSSNCL